VIAEMLDASLADRAQEMEHEVSFCAGDTCLLHGVALIGSEQSASNHPEARAGKLILFIN